MSEKINAVCKRGSIALTIVNALLLLATLWQVYHLSLRFGDSTDTLLVRSHAAIQALLSMHSLLLVCLTVILLAVLIGKEWLRPSWMPLVLNLLWLAACCRLLYYLTYCCET